MKRIFISFGIAASIGCSEAPRTKSTAESSTAAVSRYIVRTASGQSISDVEVLQVWNQNASIILNRKSGNILSFTTNGVRMQITRTLYESADCSGQILAFPGAEPNFKNKLFVNSGGYAPSAQALRVTGYFTTTKNFQSQFTGGVCSAFVGTGSGGVYLVPGEFDSTDPVDIEVPLEVNLSI